MASLLSTLREASKQSIDSMSPVAILFGVVKSVDPLKIKVDQRFTLDEDFLVLSEHLTHYEIDLSHLHSYTDDGVSKNTSEELAEPIVIREGLKVDDEVYLIRMQGGQKFIVADKVVV